MKNYKKGFGSVAFLVSVFIILMTFSVWYYLYQLPEQRYWVSNEVVSVATSSDEVAGWKTYKNDEYGFEFKYPREWRLESNSNAGVVYSPDFTSQKNFLSISNGCVITVASYGETSTDDSNESLEKIANVHADGRIATTTFTTLNGNNGIRFSHSAGENNNSHEVVIFLKDGKEYIIEAQYLKGSVQPYKDVFSMILSTFKFTN